MMVSKSVLGVTFAMIMTMALFPLAKAAAKAALIADIPAEACHLTLQSEAASAESCALSKTETLVSLSLWRVDQTPLVMQAVFVGDALRDPSHGTGRFWTRMWIASGIATLSEAEQLSLRQAILAHGESIDSNTFAMADYLGSFVEAGSQIPEFEPEHDAHFSSLIHPKSRFNTICDSVGKKHKANYCMNGFNVSSVVTVGEVSTKCKGRCGAGCFQPGQIRKNQYTQECLDHDVCHAETGDQLGICKEAFWKAAYGYMNAPDCSSY